MPENVPSLSIQSPVCTMHVENKQEWIAVEAAGIMAALVSTDEQRILLRNVSWDTYERILADQMEYLLAGVPRSSRLHGQ